jgi:hypothetical protein
MMTTAVTSILIQKCQEQQKKSLLKNKMMKFGQISNLKIIIIIDYYNNILLLLLLYLLAFNVILKL